MTLAEVVDRLRAGETLKGLDPESSEQLHALGLREGQDGGFHWPVDLAPLDEGAVRAALSPAARRWLRRLELFGVIDSTNTRLQALASTGALSGALVTAECQTAGRGRQGRSWLSPLGSSLAVSLGIELRRSPETLGGLSLVVGLALVEALDPQGAHELKLKWPNDVLAPRGKLAGILLELAQTTRSGSEVIIGIGLNLRLPEAVRQNVSQAAEDLHGLIGAGAVQRSELLGRISSSVVEFVEQFDEKGFPPFRDAFEAIHALQGERCVLHDATRRETGRVLGIDDGGRLRFLPEELESKERLIASGELSIRRL